MPMNMARFRALSRLRTTIFPSSFFLRSLSFYPNDLLFDSLCVPENMGIHLLIDQNASPYFTFQKYALTRMDKFERAK